MIIISTQVYARQGSVGQIVAFRPVSEIFVIKELTNNNKTVIVFSQVWSGRKYWVAES